MTAATAPTLERGARRGRTGRWLAITAAELIIGVHLVLTPMHLEAAPYVGALFIAGNLLLFAAILLLASSEEARQHAGWALGGAVCAGEFVGFVLSRTIGLPYGYHEAWTAGPEDLLGLASLGCEVVFAAAMVLSLLRRRRPDQC